MLAQVILQGQGPLPLEAQFDFQSTEPANVLISASAYTATGGGTPIAVQLLIDGKAVATARAWTNEAQSHKTLVSGLAEVMPSFGTHEVALQVAGGTVTDANDYFSVTLIY